MSAASWLAALAFGAGLALVVVGLIVRAQSRREQIDIILGTRGAKLPGDEDNGEERSALIEGTVEFADRLVAQVDTQGGLLKALDDARLPLRVGEFVTAVAIIGLAVAVLGGMLTSNWLVGAALFVATPFIARGVLRYRVKKRLAAFSEQLPDTLAVLGASLEAGHTFLRAIQMICEETEPPVSEEFARVVAETQLGLPLMDALERMAVRVPIRDVEWIVQAIRIQQEVGGRLAELLAILADFIRSREEVRREIAALTAEGRISAWVVGAIPVFLFLFVEIFQPEYMKPMLQGWGYFWLGLTLFSVVSGMLIIRRMVDGVEV